MPVRCTSIIRHWLPIVTICPVNNLPDLIYISVQTSEFVELYAARKRIRKVAAWKRLYMEDIIHLVFGEFPEAEQVTLNLAFNRHSITIRNEDDASSPQIP